MDIDTITPNDVQIWAIENSHAYAVKPERMAWMQDSTEIFTGTQAELLDKLNDGQKIKFWVTQGTMQVHRRDPLASSINEAIEYLESEQACRTEVRVDPNSIDNDLKKRVVLASRTSQRMLRFGGVWLKWYCGGFYVMRASKKRKSSRRPQRKLTTVNLLNAMHNQLYRRFKVMIRQHEWDFNKVKAISDIFIKLTSKKIYMQQFGQIIHDLADEITRVKAMKTPPKEGKFGVGWSDEFGDWILDQEEQRKRMHVSLKPKTEEDDMLKLEFQRAGIK